MTTAPGDSSTVRVGDAERQTAIAQLRSQWQAGRLDPTEHEARTTKAYAAVTRADLDALFRDLPALPFDAPAGPAAGALATPAAGAPMPATAPVTPMTPMPSKGSTSSNQGGLIPQGSWVHGKRSAIMALTPFVALGLFLLTDKWWFFLLIPAFGALFYAGDDGKSERRRDRHERRRLERGE